MDMEYYVYILASKKYGTLYIGVTNDPLRRVHEHREDMISGFTKNMACTSWCGLSGTKISMRQYYARNE